MVDKIFSRSQVNEGLYLMRELNEKLKNLSSGGMSWTALAGLLLQAVTALLLAVIMSQK